VYTSVAYLEITSRNPWRGTACYEGSSSVCCRANITDPVWRVWIHQRSLQNPSFEEGQTSQLPSVKGH